MADGGRSRPRVDREEAFQYWASLPFDRRSYAAVARKFGISPRTIERYARDGAWRVRLREIEAEATRRTDDELGRRLAKQRADFFQLIEASCVTYARQLASGQVKITASDLVGLIKVSLLLHGAPSDRLEVLGGGQEWAVLRTRILDAISPYPEARLALAEALEEVDDEQTGS